MFRFSVISNIDDKLDNEKSEDIVDSNDHILDSTVGSKTEIVVHDVFITYLNIVDF